MSMDICAMISSLTYISNMGRKDKVWQLDKGVLERIAGLWVRLQDECRGMCPEAQFDDVFGDTVQVVADLPMAQEFMSDDEFVDLFRYKFRLLAYRDKQKRRILCLISRDR